MKTRYRKVKKFPKYLVTNKGTVWSKRQGRWKQLKTPCGKNGYPVVVLHDAEGKPKMFYVHILVLTAFVGPCPKGKEACHFPDRTKTNCRLDNLRWDTKEGNTKDKIKHGTILKGEQHGMAILTDAQVLQMRDEYKGWGNPSIDVFAKRYKVAAEAVRKAIVGDTFKHLPNAKGLQQITQDLARDILIRWGQCNMTVTEFWQKHFPHLKRRGIYQLITGVTFKDILR